jgi:hypothetical protein
MWFLCPKFLPRAPIDLQSHERPNAAIASRLLCLGASAMITEASDAKLLTTAIFRIILTSVELT